MSDAIHVCGSFFARIVSARSPSRRRAIHSRTLGLAAAVLAVALWPPSSVMAQPCDPSVCGSWEGPFDTGVSPNEDPDCIMGGVYRDEAGHAALIPHGAQAGRILIWTQCHDKVNPSGDFLSYIWESDTNTLMEEPGFDDAPQHHFCSGHTWRQDGTLLVVGGHFPDTKPCGVPQGKNDCAAWKATVFDPAGPSGVAWVDVGAPDLVFNSLELGRWYPGVITRNDDVNLTTVPICVGGTDPVSEQCPLPNPPPFGQYAEWLSLDPSLGWIEHLDTYYWHAYPRLFLLSGGDVLSAAHELVCTDTTIDPIDGLQPVHVIDAATDGVLHGPDPNACDNDCTTPPGPAVGARHFAPAVILHTLMAGWTWPVDPGDGPSIVQRYALDRVIVSGGSQTMGSGPALTITQELQDAAKKPQGQWWWREKQSAKYGRFMAPLVILPTGKLFAVGGKTRVEGTWPLFYNGVPEIFDPQGPGSPGSWSDMAPRWLDSNGYPIPREDHSMALLLPSGRVVVLGGKNVPQPVGQPPPHPSDEWAEIFNPPYFYKGPRPALTKVPDPESDAIVYGQTFCVDVHVEDVQDIIHASLLGVSSATHGVDYGQRYIELMVKPATCTGPTYQGNLTIIAPPIPAMAPAGYYLLFVVDDQDRPSNGQFVRVDYQ